MAMNRLARWLAVDAEPGLTSRQRMPVEPARRKWGSWNFVAFWTSDAFNINTWMIAGSMVTGGLAWWQAWVCVWLGYLLAAVFVCLTARIGAVYHIGFPVVNRASFGVWGSLWPVFNRAAMACIWYGVQAYIGGQCVYLMIRAVWPSWNRATIHNTFPPTSGTTTADYASFFLFWLASLPALWFPVQSLRHLFTVKAYFVPCTGIAFFAWTLARAGGAGPVLRQGASVGGAARGWAMVRGIMSCLANFATLIVNAPDFARFARRPHDALLPQLVTIPLSFGLTSFVGVGVSSAAAVLYGAPVWNPLDVLDHFLGGDGNKNNQATASAGAGARAGVFVIAAALALAQLGTNLAANSVSAGTDLAALLPRFVNIRRGSYVCAAVGLAMCPYTLLTDSNRFTTYLSAYAVFLSSVAGVMVGDYYAVRRGGLDVPALYDARAGAPYHFWHGFHWRAYAAYLAGILVNVVGFAGAVGAAVPPGATYLYHLNFLCGFLVALAVYWLLCRLSPVPACHVARQWTEADNVGGGGGMDAMLGDDAAGGEKEAAREPGVFAERRNEMEA